MMGGKINKHVAIKQKLDLSAFSSKKSAPLTYKLVSMVTHLGSSQHCGHYTAVGVTDSGVYYQFDDSCVRSMSIQNALSTNAYIIFYELDDVNTSFDQNKILKETVISKTSTEVKARNDTITTGFTSLASFKINTFNKTAVQSSPVAPTQPINNKTSPDKTKIVNFPTNGFTIKEKPFINNSPVKNNNEIKTICRNGNNLNNGKQLGSKLVIHFKDKKESENSDENKTFLVNGKNATNVLHKKAITSTNISENSEKKSTNKSLPCMPKLIEEKSSQIVTTPSPPTTTKITTTKVKSLVPYDDDSDDSTETVKTTVGIWEVTDDTMPSPILNGRTNCSSNKFKQNGNKSENSIVQNGNGKIKPNQNGIKEDTVSQLLKLGHRGYGASVVSWNGESANITKEVSFFLIYY